MHLPNAETKSNTSTEKCKFKFLLYNSLESGSSSNHAACPHHPPTCNAVQLFIGQWQLAKFQLTNVKALNGQQVLASTTSVIKHPWIKIDIIDIDIIFAKATQCGLNQTWPMCWWTPTWNTMVCGCHGTLFKIKMMMGGLRVAHGSPVQWASPSSQNQRSSHWLLLHWCSLQCKWPSFQKNLT